MQDKENRYAHGTRHPYKFDIFNFYNLPYPKQIVCRQRTYRSFQQSSFCRFNVVKLFSICIYILTGARRCLGGKNQYPLFVRQGLGGTTVGRPTVTVVKSIGSHCVLESRLEASALLAACNAFGCQARNRDFSE